MIQQYHCYEKLDTGHSKGLKRENEVVFIRQMMIDSLSCEKLTDLKWSSNDDLQWFAKN